MPVAPVLDAPWFRRVVTWAVEVLCLPRTETGVRLHANEEGGLREQPECRHGLVHVGERADLSLAGPGTRT